NLRGLPPQQVADFGASAGLDAAKTEKLRNSLSGLALEAAIAADVDIRVRAICADASAAQEVSGQLNAGLAALKQGKDGPPKEIIDLLDKVRLTTDGQNVVVATRLEVAPLIKIYTDSMAALTPRSAPAAVKPVPTSAPPPALARPPVGMPLSPAR